MEQHGWLLQIALENHKKKKNQTSSTIHSMCINMHFSEFMQIEGYTLKKLKQLLVKGGDQK